MSSPINEQAGDIYIFQTNDDGDINVNDGITQMTCGYESAIYLSLFGGNDDDAGDESTSHLQYWGNFAETDPQKKLRSETQNIIASLPSTSSNLRLLEEANLRDLAWMSDSVSNLTSDARITSPDFCEITITYEAEGQKESFTYSVNWEAMRR